MWFKHAITGIQFDNKENYPKLIHNVGKKQIKITNIWYNTKTTLVKSREGSMKGI